MIKFSSQNDVTECAKEKQQWIKIESEKKMDGTCQNVFKSFTLMQSIRQLWVLDLLCYYHAIISPFQPADSHVRRDIIANWLHEFVSVNFCALFCVICVECLEKALNGKSMIEWNRKYQNTVLWNISWYSCHSFEYGRLRNVWSWTFSKSVYMNGMLMDRIFLRFIPKNQWILSTWFSTSN